MTQETKPDDKPQFLAFIQQQALAMRSGDEAPDTLSAWQSRRAKLKQQLIESWGGFPSTACPLDTQKVGELKRDGYRVEKLLLQTRPGIRMTANAYVPTGNGRRPAVLCVHGHWRLAKQEPTVQSRCIGLAKLGFFVLAVDAFGAGERGVGKPLGEYHGEMVASTLWPSGLALAGLQVYENMRAVDYLLTRPEVDPQRLGVTGCSGGGNQTMYVGAIDERLQSVVPVCSVGTYQAYLGAACCMCEVTPAALTYTEEAGVISLVAPRALMLINATRDSFQFSVGEAAKSLAAARPIFQLYGKEQHAQRVVVDAGHGYDQEMREAMYGWMNLHLQGTGDGSPVSEPEISAEEPESLRCFPGESRPDNFVTLPQFAAAQARKLLAQRPAPSHSQRWKADEMIMQKALADLLGNLDAHRDLQSQISRDDPQRWSFTPEHGLRIPAQFRQADPGGKRLALLLDLDEGRAVLKGPLATQLLAKGWDVVGADLRATASLAQPNDKIGRAPDHNTAEWSLWIGRPLLGQWLIDAACLLASLERQAGSLPADLLVVGIGPASVLAICLAALDSRIRRVATVDGLASFVSDAPYQGQRMGILAPGILRDVGDVPQLAALLSPRQLVIAGGVDGRGNQLNADALAECYRWTQAAYDAERAAENLRILDHTEPQAIVDAF